MNSGPVFWHRSRYYLLTGNDTAARMGQGSVKEDGENENR